MSLEHFAVVANHLSDVDRIVPAVFWALVIDVAGEFLAIRRHLQPGATSKILAGCGIDPYFSALDVASNIGSVSLPPVNLFRRRSQATVAGLLTTLAT